MMPMSRREKKRLERRGKGTEGKQEQEQEEEDKGPGTLVLKRLVLNS
jgi:hypothetical protein